MSTEHLAKKKPAERPTVFGPSFTKDFPPELRRQLWPLCCGASIISGFKDVGAMTEEQLVDEINYICTIPRPDFQVYHFESMKPALTFLTLNYEQMNSPKIMRAIETAGFVKIGEASPRGMSQGFFLKDTSLSWKSFTPKKKT